MSVTERIVMKDLYVPFEEGNDRREDLVNTIIEKNMKITALESKIALLKSEMKPLVEDRDDAIDDLTKGEKHSVRCKESIFWDDNRVVTVRLDTLETLPERAITEEDRQHQTDDVDVE